MNIFLKCFGSRENESLSTYMYVCPQKYPKTETILIIHFGKSDI